MRHINPNDIRNGDTLLVDRKGIVPDAIHFFQGNRYNHAAIFIWVGGKLYVFEAIKQGQAFTLFEEYMKQFKTGDIDIMILRPKTKKDIDFQEFFDFIAPLTHKPYGLVNLLIYQPVKFIGKWFGKDWWIGGDDNTRNFICGELVAYIYNHFLGWFKDWYKIAPVALFNSTNLKHYYIKK